MKPLQIHDPQPKTTLPRHEVAARRARTPLHRIVRPRPATTLAIPANLIPGWSSMYLYPHGV